MVIGCPHCSELFKSLLIETDKASVEVYDQYLKHFTYKHPKEFQEFAKSLVVAQSLAAGYMLMTAAKWPEDDSQAWEAYEKTGNKLLEVLDFDTFYYDTDPKEDSGVDNASNAV